MIRNYTAPSYSLGTAIRDYVVRNPRAIVNAAKAIYNTASLLKSKPRAPATTPSAPATVRTRANPLRVIKSFRKTRKAYINKRKRTKINKLVGKSIGKTNPYNKRSKRMRTHNTGKLSLQQRLQNGGSLPNTTYARLFWRGSLTTGFACLKNSAAAGSNSSVVAGRTFCLNDISSSPSYSQSAVMVHSVTYAPMWKSLYRQYLVLGATAKFKINPSFYPQAMGTTTINPTAGVHTNAVPLNAQPGYWYVRAYYKRSNPLTNERDAVGHPIVPGIASTIEDTKKEDCWPTLRDFLSDPTVTYKKDMTNIRTKLHIHSDSNVIGQDPATSNTNFTPSTGCSYEIETATKPVYLKVNFSAKKHFQDKNILRNGPWNEWDTNLPADDRFQVRIGYIGFGESGYTQYHIPIDRNTLRFVETEIQYFVSLRDPLINPHDEQITNMRALRELDTIPNEIEEQLESDDELEPEPELDELPSLL